MIRHWCRLVALAVCLFASPSLANPIVQADYINPTDRYTHGVLGDAIEWGGLELTFVNDTRKRFELPTHLVFEDLTPRLHDLDNDGMPEVITVLTHQNKGAALAVFGAEGLIAQTPHIGKRNRWLAPIGAGDLFGDGDQIIAYIDRPHLTKTLRLWRYKKGKLIEAGQLSGLTNHRIGDDFILGGVRTCTGRDDIVTIDANWKNVMITNFHDDTPTSQPAGSYEGPHSVDQALNCP